MPYIFILRKKLQILNNVYAIGYKKTRTYNYVLVFQSHYNKNKSFLFISDFVNVRYKNKHIIVFINEYIMLIFKLIEKLWIVFIHLFIIRFSSKKN